MNDLVARVSTLMLRNGTSRLRLRYRRAYAGLALDVAAGVTGRDLPISAVRIRIR